MKKHIVPIFRLLLLAGLVAVAPGCVVVKVNSSGHKQCCASQPGNGPWAPCEHVLDNTPWPKPGDYTEEFNPPAPGAPAGNSGMVTVPVASLSSGSHACFPASAGWNKYFPLPRYFLGPGVVPNALSFTNVDQLTQCTVSTCDPNNGATLETAVVIYEEYNPNTDRVCVSNAGCPGTKLTKNQRTIVSGKRYRATVFFKSTTLGGLANVKIHWSYP
jgi:hypothetical protein